MLEQCEICNNNMEWGDVDNIPICEECLNIASRKYWEQSLKDWYEDS